MFWNNNGKLLSKEKLFDNSFCISVDGKCQGFQCASGSCVGNYTLCNGQCECEEDCRDEKVCNCTGLYVCNDGQCLVAATEELAFCNGAIQCADGR